MATLAGNTIASTYALLLKIDNTGIATDGTLRKVEDGDATDSALSISDVSISVDATDKIYLDAGGNTYLHEVSADKLDIVVGGQTILELAEGGGGASDYMAIQALNKLYLDGGGNTYFQESAADEVVLVCGGESIRIADATGTGENTIFGVNAGASLDSGSDANVFIGADVADGSLSSADNNVAIGHTAMSGLTNGARNVAIGRESMATLTGGGNNVAVGDQSLDAAAVGESGNVAIGKDAMSAVDEGTADGDADLNVAIGYQALLGGDFAGNDRQQAITRQYCYWS